MADVLILEDQRELVTMMKFKLEQCGHSVRSAPNAKAALDRCFEEMPDIAVLDVELPGMSGLEVARRIRSMPGRQPHIIIVSARGARADIEAGYAAGADEYMTKPFSPVELVRRIDACLAP